MLACCGVSLKRCRRFDSRLIQQLRPLARERSENPCGALWFWYQIELVGPKVDSSLVIYTLSSGLDLSTLTQHEQKQFSRRLMGRCAGELITLIRVCSRLRPVLTSAVLIIFASTALL